MNRIEKIRIIRQLLTSGQTTIGSWIQIPDASVAEIMGQAGYDWVAVDMEHGSIGVHQLPDIFRALELGGTLSLVRLAQGHVKDCKQALDAGAGGVIIPMVENAEQLINIRDYCYWPPAGSRGVGFSRANLFGKHFASYSEEAQKPLFVAMIEHIRAVENLDAILKVKGLDAILIGPYDLSSSLGKTGQFNEPEFIAAMDQILALCKQFKIPAGVHVVMPDPALLKIRISEGYRFIAYSIDSVFLNSIVNKPQISLL
jgi:2-dehydro-3-deoxyglucarate aldolase